MKLEIIAIGLLIGIVCFIIFHNDNNDNGGSFAI